MLISAGANSPYGFVPIMTPRTVYLTHAHHFTYDFITNKITDKMDNCECYWKRNELGYQFLSQRQTRKNKTVYKSMTF